MNFTNVQATWVNSEQDSMLHRITNRIRRSLELQEVLTATVAEVRSLLGTERVKIYKFNPDQSGQVVAESIYDNHLPSLLGLNFPAADIPLHARELFIKSRVRSVVDVNSQQIGHSHLQELEDGDTLAEDIRYRPVDPCHVEYLTAMGVKSSVVVPIFHQEQLWGLLVSHHSESRAIPDAELKLLQGVVDQLSIAIAQSEHLAQAREQAQREAALNRLNNFLHSLSTIELQPALEEAVAAFQGAGGRLCIKATADDLQDETSGSFAECLKTGKVQVYTSGVQPIPPELAKYILMEQYSVWQEHYQAGEYDIWAVSDLYRTDALRNLQAAFYTTKIRSLLMIPLQYRQQLFGYLSIFRDEFETETLWAGRVEEDERQINPHLSFEVWRDARRAQTHEWSTSELELAYSIGRQFSTAIYQYEIRQQLQTLNTNLESQVQERTAKLLEAADDIQQAAEQQRVLFEVVTKMRESLKLETIFQTTTRELCKSLQIDRVSVYRFTPDWGGEFVGDFEFANSDWAEVKLGVNTVWNDMYLQETQAGRYRNGYTFVVDDVSQAKLSPCHVDILKQFQIKAFATAPIFVGQNLWGLLAAYQHTNVRHWETSQVKFLSQIAAQLGVAIQQAELLAQTQQQTTELQQAADSLQRAAEQQRVLFEVVAKIRESLNLETIFQTTTQETCKVLRSDRVAVYRFYPDWSGEFVHDFEFVTPGWGKLARFGTKTVWEDTHLQETQGGRYRNGESFAVDNIYEVGHSHCHIEILEQFQIKAYALAPIFVGQKLWGLLAAYQHSGSRSWKTSEIKFLSQVAAQLGVAIQQADLLNHTQNHKEQLAQTLHELQNTQTQLIQTEKMSSLGQLVAGVAHEINNPVNFIHGNLLHVKDYSESLLSLLELYQKCYPEPGDEIDSHATETDLPFVCEDLPKILDSMQIGTNRIRQIVQSLQNFSRLDQAEMKSVDIHEGIDSTLMILQHRLKANVDHCEIQVIKEYGNLPLIECYPGQLNQVFMNLLSNAVDALEVPKRSLQDIQANPSIIRIHTQPLEGSRIAIHIADNGIGMPQEVQHRIFDPFFTTKAIGKGTGLGLSISYQIVVEKHRGEIRCIAAPGQGTKFVIEIPTKQNVAN